MRKTENPWTNRFKRKDVMFSHKYKLAAAFFSCLLLSSPAFPREPEPANQTDTLARIHGPAVIVVGPARRLPKIAGSATVLEQAEFSASRVFNTNELLRKVPGLHLREEDAFALRPNIGLRGLNPTRSTKMLLLEDGIPLAYSPYGDNASYYHPPVERFDRTEVLKGSEQILFGPQTIGGVVNYITPTPKREWNTLLHLTGGGRHNFAGRARLGGEGLLFDLTRKQGDGSRDNEKLEITDLNLKGLFTWDTRQALVVRANAYHEDSRLSYTGITEAERANFGLYYNPYKNDRFVASRYGLSTTYNFAFTPQVELLTSLYGSHFSRDWWRQSSTTTDTQGGDSVRVARQEGRPVDPDTINSVQGRLRDFYAYGVEPRLSARYGLLGMHNEFNAGLRAHYEIQDRLQKNGSTPTARDGIVVEDNDRETDAYSGFLQNRFGWGKWTLTPALRIEHIINERTNNLTGGNGRTDFTELVPGVGATFNPLTHTTLFAGLHRGFAPPRTEDLILTPGGQPTATFTDVDPEKSVNAEFGLRTAPRSGLRLEATLFRNDFENLIAVGSIAGGSTPLAQAKVLFEGLEFMARAESKGLLQTAGNLYVQTAYTLLPTAKQSTAFVQVANQQPVSGSQPGNRLPYAPRHTVSAGVGYTASSGWDLRLDAVYVSSQFSDFANTEAPSANGQVGRIPDYTIFNLVLNYSAKPWRTTLFFTAKNLFDRQYIADRTRGIRPGLPRLVQAGLEWGF
jgi:Fe(3+) dicitrate transport protein